MLAVGPQRRHAMVQAPVGNGDQTPIMNAIDYSPLGRLQRRDSRGHLREDGMSLHYFDLNLMPLPPGGEQHWQVTVYAGTPCHPASEPFVVRCSA